MENKNTETKFSTVKKGETYTECAAEYILPDYKGDVKRVLHTEAKALPSGSFVDSTEAEFDGVVVFDVLYLDSENRLSSVTFSTDYSLKAPVDQTSVGVHTECSAENVSVRLPGPRKMLGRCTVRHKVYDECEVCCAAMGSTFDEKSQPELCKSSVNALRTLRAKLSDREYAEELMFIPGAALDDVEVIAKRGDVRINSVSARTEGVSISGEISVSALIGGENPYVKECTFPFEENVTLSGASEGMSALAKGELVSLECAGSPTDDGVRISVSAIADFDVCAYSNDSVSVVSDAYSAVAETENKYENMKYGEFLDAKRSSSRLSREIPKVESDAECAKDIVYVSATARADSIKIETSSVKIEGEVRFSGVACEFYEDGTPTYTSLKFSVPFSESVNFNLQIPEDAAVECSIECYNARISVDNDNFYAECEICFNAVLCAEREMERLASSEVIDGSYSERPASVISVYYPEDTDTLFGVAKRFKVSPLKLAQDNALTEESVSMQNKTSSLVGVKKLIVKNT